MFRVGQKVVCVDPDSPSVSGRCMWENDAPVRGQIYTVRRCFVDFTDTIVVWLEEIERGPMARAEWGDDIGYAAWRFRPLVSRPTDISIFHEILDDVNNRTPEPVA